MDLTSALVGGLSLGLFMAISVGPTLFAIIRYSLNHSYKTGLAFVLGVSVSDILYVTVANLASPWLEALHRFEKWLAYGGGALLIIMGLMGLLQKHKPTRPKKGIAIISGSHYARIFGSGFLINTLNPGVVINWLAAAAAVANRDTPFRVVFFGSCLGLVLGIDFLKVFAADGIRQKLTLRRILYLQKTSAFLLFGAGVLLVLAATFGWMGLG